LHARIVCTPTAAGVFGASAAPGPASRSMRPTRSTRGALVSAVIVVLILSLVALPGTAAVARQSSRPIYQPPQRYYLALGDSMTYGFQPDKAKPGARPSDFDTGYVDVFAARMRKLSPRIDVVNYGCSGESTVTFTRGGWRCDGFKAHDAFHGPQLKAAVAFLRAHPGQVSPITLTLWGGDLAPLSAKGRHAQSAIASFASRLNAILKQLRAAAPTAEIIVTGAWNPEADRLRQVEPLYRSLDAAIGRVAVTSHDRVANMFAALNGPGNTKAQQARLCRLTFYCTKGDPHPTDAGYRAMADAFMTASGYPRNP
jgi:lysophospholipase L1-like esterase